jgi:hypothetical protein
MQPTKQAAARVPSYTFVLEGNGARRRVEVEERDVPVALIDLSVYPSYRLQGLIDAGPRYGVQMSASASFYRDGRVYTVTGAVVPVDLTQPKIVVPLGFFSRAH